MAQVYLSTQDYSTVAAMQRVLALDLWIALGMQANAFEKWMLDKTVNDAWVMLLHRVEELRPMQVEARTRWQSLKS